MKILNKNEYEYLSFQDFIDTEKDWITVHRVDPPNTEHADRQSEFIINSALISKEQLSKILNNIKEFNLYEGFQPEFLQLDNNDYVLICGYHLHEDVLLEPFVYSRPKVKSFPEVTEINQEFILYFDLRKEGEYYVEPNSEEKVIKSNSKYFQVNAHYLKEYLAAKKSCLIRYFGLYRVNKRITFQEVMEDTTGRYESKIHNNYQFYELSILDHVNKYVNSFLHGKEIILPYEKPHNSFFTKIDKDIEHKYENFIIGRDDQGNAIEKSCDPQYFNLEICYFKIGVLDKYYNNHNEYHVENEFLIRKHNDWYLSFGINEEDLVTVYLNGLGKIPHKEQLYWKSYNVNPLGNVNTRLFQSQMLAQYSDSDNIISKLFSNREVINRLFIEKKGFQLFLDLQENDEYVKRGTRLIYLERQLDFDFQILNLTKIFVDSLNSRELKHRISAILEPETRSIGFLEQYLKENIPKSETLEIVSNLRILQNLRSNSSAHRKSVDYDEIIRKVSKSESTTLKGIFIDIVNRVNTSLEEVIQLLSI